VSRPVWRCSRTRGPTTAGSPPASASANSSGGRGLGGGPLIAGWLMIEVNMASVFYVGGAFAITGVLAFLAILAHDHGRAALTAW